MAEEEEKQEWRAAFRRRLVKACQFLCGDERLGLTQRRHLRPFVDLVSKNNAYRDEISKLAPFELVVLSISSTEQQLQTDLGYFAAEEVKEALMARKYNEQRCDEVRTWLQKSELQHIFASLNKVLMHEDPRVQNARDWIMTTFSRDGVNKLVNELINALEQNNRAPPPDAPRSGGFLSVPGYKECSSEDQRRTDLPGRDHAAVSADLTKAGSTSVKRDPEALDREQMEVAEQRQAIRFLWH